ncbi:GFA family protein [Sphingomonas sp.]|uniref:GFA family protein n=1 Tax=Sphingomonas sp. TaxID=28214 RepID=UPI003CC5B07C
MILAGGCQCGRIRYRVEVDELDAYLCHCRMCQRATGGFAAALKQVKRGAITWAREPDRYRSSPIAQRGFCAACGTPLTYEGDGSEGLDLTVGSFDEAGRLTPVEHSGVESIHEAWLHTASLPRSRTDANPRIVQKWKDAGADLPD